MTKIRIAAAAYLIQKARKECSVDQHGINVFIARAQDEAGMLTVPATKEATKWA